MLVYRSKGTRSEVGWAGQQEQGVTGQVAPAVRKKATKREVQPGNKTSGLPSSTKASLLKVLEPSETAHQLGIKGSNT